MDNNNNYRTAAYNPMSSVAIENAFINRVFGWMTAGLALTGFIAFFVAERFAAEIIKYSDMLILLMVLEVILVIGLSAALNRISAAVAFGGFLLYAALNGVTMSVIFMAYTKESIASTFFIASGTFGVMGLYGWMTKKDLSTIGSICFMGLIGIIIASLINFFLPNRTASLVINIIGVLIFVGLTAYDMQKIKHLATSVGEGEIDEENSKKLSLIGALELYLDFINLFLYLLRFFGRRR
jgi:FtsH-binding integral membrane protein